MTLDLHRIMSEAPKMATTYQFSQEGWDELHDAITCALYLLAEARHVAAEWRADAWDYCRTPEDPVEPVPGEDIMPMPWEVTL